MHCMSQFRTLIREFLIFWELPSTRESFVYEYIVCYMLSSHTAGYVYWQVECRKYLCMHICMCAFIFQTLFIKLNITINPKLLEKYVE